MDRSMTDDCGAIWSGEMLEHSRVFEETRMQLMGAFSATLGLIEQAVSRGGKILIFGNGGSASDAQHIAAELVIRYKADRAPIAAIALTTDSSVLTACGNDLGYDQLFARQVLALAKPIDVVVGISTSGRSPNVLAGLRAARELGAVTVGFTGSGGGDMTQLCDAVVAVPSTVTARIQEMHILIGHMICKGLEQRLGLV